MYIEDLLKLTQLFEQFELPTEWNTDEYSLSVDENILKRARKYIGLQLRFDSKPLAIAMCYCCGCILRSRIDNCHTTLVNVNVKDSDIPAVAYQSIVCQSKYVLEYRHKSGKLYACCVCKSFKLPKELNIQFHVGKVTMNDHVLPIEKWDMSYPNEILSLQNQVECSQVALCGLFSTVLKMLRNISGIIYRVKSIQYTA